MGPLTLTGVGSKLNVEEIVTKLVSLERKPIESLNAASDKTRTKISAFGKIQSALEALRTASAKLGDPSVWQSIVASSSDPAIATVAGSSGVADGTYHLAIRQLASAQSVSSPMFNRDQRLGAGSLKIELGQWSADGSAFTPKADGSPTSISIIEGLDSLVDIRDRINSANAGVVASVVNDARGARLVMRSKETGAEGGFRVTGLPDGGEGRPGPSLAALGFDGSDGAGGMRRDLRAANAELSMNGLDLSMASNSLAGVIDGMTVSLIKTGEVSATARPDKESTKKAINEFVTAYNSVIGLIRDNIKYDASTKVAGTLQGDSAAVGIQDRLRRGLSSAAPANGAFQHISEVGLSVGVNGAISVNDDKLGKALGARGDLKQLFMGLGKDGPQDAGIATRLRSLADDLLSIDGVLQSRTNGLQSTLKDNAKRVEAIEERAANYQQRLYDQYTSLDKTMSNLGQAAAYLGNLGR